MSEFALPGGIAPHRINAMILRYWYLLLSSWPRLLELIYWPALQIITWGFLQIYIAQNAGFFARAGGTLIGAVILWDILFRGQLGFSISFLEEMWARNLGNLMMSPLKPIEFLIAQSDLHQLVAGDFRFRPGAAQWLGCREYRVDADVRGDAAGLHLLSGDGVAALAAICRLGAAADLCIRRNAGAVDRACISDRPDDVSPADQRGALHCVICDISCALAQRPPPRFADPGWRISHSSREFESHEFEPLRLAPARGYTDLCIDALLRIRQYAAVQKI